MTICEALTNVLVFLAQNEEYGDDWSEETTILEGLLTKAQFDDEHDEETIFRKVQHDYFVEDAKAQVEQYLWLESLISDSVSDPDDYVDDFDYDYLADVFADEKDCNVADNDVWQTIIADYVKNDLGAAMTQLREDFGIED